ncbi:FG-GAP repeat domain-containing protein [Streptomyces roseolus]|uniref:FG-GAP repeat domain-containing protein n=1 Tax=Streptomyces roseolus TaxID=67358 RepID=UPI0019CA2791|nr:VCBS repeat-containing protein [Streptomyces roseolus]GGR39944.1 hypothetical protein GCM10010282_35830 [Streptomyces roseolus]
MSRLITTALAVVLATGSAAPALAAPAAPAGALPAAVAEAAEEQLLPLPAGTVAGAGTTGYLVRDLDADTYSWVRFDTGATTELPFARIPYIQGADSVAESTYSGTATKVRDMTTGTVVLTVDNNRLYRANVLGAVGSTLLAAFPDDATGREVLWLYRPGTGSATRPFATRKRIGGGWQAYDRIAATGNLAGGAAGDLVARDRTGVLWLYLGKGDGTFAPRTKIGGGWNAYTDITGAADMNNDGRNDLVAMDRLGETFVHQGTGAWKTPFQRGYQTSGSQYEHDLMS